MPFALLFCVVALVAHAQPGGTNNITGVYLTKDDFLNNTLAFAHENDAQNYLGKDVHQNLRLTRDGKTSIFEHDDIFGFSLNGIQYVRFGKRETVLSDVGYYRIEDMRTLIIYSRGGYDAETYPIFYFFNRQLDAPVHKLTFQNLEKEFTGQSEFLTALKEHQAKLKGRLDMKSRDSDVRTVNDLIEKYVKKN